MSRNILHSHTEVNECRHILGMTLDYNSPRAVVYDIVVVSVFWRKKSGGFGAARMVVSD